MLLINNPLQTPINNFTDLAQKDYIQKLMTISCLLPKCRAFSFLL